MRIEWLDSLRGFAILFMILDHLIVHFFPALELLRYLTRVSFPLFMLVSGYLLDKRSINSVLRGSTIILIFALSLILFDISNPKISVFNVLYSIGISLPLAYILPLNSILILPLFIPLDLSANIIDYGIVFTTFVLLLGRLLAREDWIPILFSLIVLAVVMLSTNYYVMFLYLIGILMALSVFLVRLEHPFLSLLGKYSLSIYVGHLYLIALIGNFI